MPLPEPVCAEDILADWLGGHIAAPPVDEVPLAGFLADCELRDTGFDSIKKRAGIRFSPCESYFEPDEDGAEAAEEDADLLLVVFARVTGQDATSPVARREARNLSINVTKAIVALLQWDNSLDGKVCAVSWGKAARDFDNTDSHTYAVVNLPLLINPREEEA